MFSKILGSFFLLWCTPVWAYVNYQPNELVSENGKLEVILNISMEYSLNGTRFSRQFNGGPVGPTIRVKPGDLLIVTLNNNVVPSPPHDIELLRYIQDPQNEIDDDVNVTKIFNRLSSAGNMDDPQFGFWGFSLANLHFHGAGFPPSVEDLYHPIDGGESKIYSYTIPEDHPPGLVWYHGHVHGNGQYDMMSGLYGAMIIEGTANDITAVPEIGNATEVVMILSESLMNATTGIPPPSFPIVMSFDWSSTVNGRLAEETEFEFIQGETVLFRTIGAGVEATAALYFNESTAPKFWILAEDGFPVPKLEASDTVNIVSGSRMEFIVKFDTPGIYTLRRAPWYPAGITGLEACTAAFNIPLPNCISYDVDKPVAIVTVLETDSPLEAELPTEVPEYHKVYKDMESMPVLNTRTITMQFKDTFPLFQIPYDGPFVPPGVGFGVNGRLLTPHHSHGLLISGTCEEWTVVADPPGMGHSFHIHTNPYLVTHEDGVAVEEPFWRDTYFVKNNFTLKTCFHHLRPGDFVLAHCHQVTHFDVGMGAAFAVISASETAQGSDNVTEAEIEIPDESAINDEAAGADLDVERRSGGSSGNTSTAASAAGHGDMTILAIGAIMLADFFIYW